jgi:D-tyrosyl-tRNA(Tyr) deacylase
LRALIQRVSAASVSIDGEVFSRIDRGLVVLLGVGHKDTDEQAARLAGKVARLRVFEGERGNMDRSVIDTRCA